EVASDYLGAMAPAFAAVLAETLGPTDWTTPPPGARPALPDSAYVGTYRNDYYGEVAVVQAGGGLALRIGPEPRELPLAHYDRDTFSWQTPIGLHSGLSFTIGGDGRATAFRDEYLADGGAGLMLRVERPALLRL